MTGEGFSPPTATEAVVDDPSAIHIYLDDSPCSKVFGEIVGVFLSDVEDHAPLKISNLDRRDASIVALYNRFGLPASTHVLVIYPENHPSGNVYEIFTYNQKPDRYFLETLVM